MLRQSTLPNPLDAQYTGHRDAAKRHLETKEWLRQREREMGFVTDAPSVAPDHHDAEKAPAPKAAKTATSNIG